MHFHLPPESAIIIVSSTFNATNRPAMTVSDSLPAQVYCLRARLIFSKFLLRPRPITRPTVDYFENVISGAGLLKWITNQIGHGQEPIALRP